MLRPHSVALKQWLLDQTHIAGIGNIYASEILHRCGLHPDTPANALDAPAAGKLLRTIRRVLNEAIKWRGTTVSEYVTGRGVPGQFQKRLRVYGNCPHHPLRPQHLPLSPLPTAAYIMPAFVARQAGRLYHSEGRDGVAGAHYDLGKKRGPAASGAPEFWSNNTTRLEGNAARDQPLSVIVLLVNVGSVQAVANTHRPVLVQSAQTHTPLGSDDYLSSEVKEPIPFVGDVPVIGGQQDRLANRDSHTHIVEAGITVIFQDVGHDQAGPDRGPVGLGYCAERTGYEPAVPSLSPPSSRDRGLIVRRALTQSQPCSD